MTTAKVDGQRRSTANLPTEAQDAFHAIIENLAVGQVVHINGLRGLLDLAEIPASSRGGLFAQAVGAGLLTPLMSPEGWKISAPSDGKSAHNADCRLYVRTVPA